MQQNFNKIKIISFILTLLIIVSCTTEPQPIKMGDTCTFCMMGVADNRFGAELISKKGKIYKFDDAHCLLEFLKANTVPIAEQKSILFIDFEDPHGFVNVDNVYLLNSEDLRSPMGSNIAAFKSLEQLKATQTNIGGEEIKWSSLISN